jgi:hypothetical protein
VTSQPTNFIDPVGLFIEGPHSIGNFFVDVRASWFDEMWDDLWGAGNGGDFVWLYDPPMVGVNPVDAAVNVAAELLKYSPCAKLFGGKNAANNLSKLASNIHVVSTYPNVKGT